MNDIFYNKMSKIILIISFLIIFISCEKFDTPHLTSDYSNHTYQRNMEEIEIKEKQVREFLRENSLEAVLLNTRHNFAWITAGGDHHVGLGSASGVAVLYFGQDGKYVILPNNEKDRIMNEELAGLEYRPIQYSWFEPRSKSISLEKLIGNKNVGSDWDFSGAINIEGQFSRLRYTLSSFEIKRYKWLCQTVAYIVENTCREIDTGMTEEEIQAVVSSKLLKKGITPTVLLIAVDDRIFNYKHAITKSAELHNYAMVNIVAEKWGLNVALTRFVHFGELDNQISKNQEKVSEIYATILSHMERDKKTGELFAIIQASYAKEGFSELWKEHHVGGLIGYKGREYKIYPGSDYIMEINQAFAWNPTLPGVKIEDTILLTEEGIKNLTYTGKWNYKLFRIKNREFKVPQILLR